MTAFNPCIVVPNYNHVQGFVLLVEKMLTCQVPIIVVNDGSKMEATEVLRQLDRDQPAVEVLHFAENRGKGAAVAAGFRRAIERGFSHALQIDADGQHDLNDLQKFLGLSHDHPDAVICGCPIYDESIPMHRKLCRYITHALVWLVTLSFTIKDSMCGFRVYPLAAVEKLFARYSIGKRMDFDIEILVKLYWDKVEILSVRTRVIYPVGGLSNYRLVKDNLILAKMHVRLVLGMLLRVPQLLLRRHEVRKQQHWERIAERGSVTGLKLMFWTYRLFGKGVFLLILHPVVLYFALCNSTARRASRQYLAQMAQYQGLPPGTGIRKVYAHFYEFGVAAIDKIASWTGAIKRSDVIIHDTERFNGILASGRGAVFIGSHLGNLELCRALGEKSGRFKITAVVFKKNALKFAQIMRACAPEVELNLLHVETISIDTAIVLKQKVDMGEIVIIVGDRTPVNSVGRIHYANFLGKKAPFAEGPCILASLLECPVYLIFCIKEAQTYNIYLELFADTLKFPRAKRQQMLANKVQEYASRLEYYCMRAPLQWFNFYDFWDTENPVTVNREQLETRRQNRRPTDQGA
jgi:predicted LPLAT superfamily acyltransferase